METLSDDTLSEIISLLDVVSIVRLLSTSKRFWRIRTKQNISNTIVPYQKYIKYKQWNKGLIESTKRNNILQLNYFIQNGADDFNSGLSTACLHGNKILVDYFIQLGASITVATLYASARGGHKDLVQNFDKFSIVFNSYAFLHAVKGGNLDLVKYFYHKGHVNSKILEMSLSDAAKRGHRPVIDFLLELGMEDYWVSGIYAAKGGHKDLAKFFWSKEDTRAPYALYGASVNGHRDIITWLIEEGDNAWNEGLNGAARGGHVDLVEFFVEKGANSFQVAMDKAASGGHAELVKYFIEKGATNFENAFLEACRKDNREVIELLFARENFGEPILNKALEKATENGHKTLVEILISKGATNLVAARDKAEKCRYRNLHKMLLEMIGNKQV